MRIPLSLDGVTSYFPVRNPIQEEYETCPQYEATYESPDWDPHDSTFAKQEELMMELHRLLQENDAHRLRGG